MSRTVEVRMPDEVVIWLDKDQCQIINENAGFITLVDDAGVAFRIANGEARKRLLDKLGIGDGESEEFVAAMTAETFVPDQSEWLWAQVQHWDAEKKVLVVALSNGLLASCVPSAITDSPGGHKNCLAQGTVGSIRLEIVKGKYRCLQAVFDGETDDEEIGQIVNWDTLNRRGWVTRPCGDWIYVIDDSPGYGRFENTEKYVVGVGDWVSFHLVRSKNNDRFIGKKIRKIEAPTAQGVK